MAASTSAASEYNPELIIESIKSDLAASKTTWAKSKSKLESDLFSWGDELSYMSRDDGDYSTILTALVKLHLSFAELAAELNQDECAVSVYESAVTTSGVQDTRTVWVTYGKYLVSKKMYYDAQRVYVRALRLLSDKADKEEVWREFLDMIRAQPGRENTTMEKLKEDVREAIQDNKTGKRRRAETTPTDDDDGDGDDGDDDGDDGDEGQRSEDGQPGNDGDNADRQAMDTESAPEDPKLVMPSKKAKLNPPTEDVRGESALHPAAGRVSPSMLPAKEPSSSSSGKQSSVTSFLSKVKEKASGALLSKNAAGGYMPADLLLMYAQLDLSTGGDKNSQPLFSLVAVDSLRDDADPFLTKLLDVETRLELVKRVVNLGQIFWDVIETLYAMDYLRWSEVSVLRSNFEASNSAREQSISSNETSALEGTKVPGAREKLKLHFDNERAARSQLLEKSKDDLEKHIRWSIRETLSTQQSILRSLKVPTFESITMDPQALHNQRVVAAVLYKAMQFRKKAGNDVYGEHLTQQLGKLETIKLEELGAKLMNSVNKIK